jgi:hypothetical protein
MFVLLGMCFLVVRLPTVVREVQAESHVGDVPLRRSERLNLALVALISESLRRSEYLDLLRRRGS